MLATGRHMIGTDSSLLHVLFNPWSGISVYIAELPVHNIHELAVMIRAAALPHAQV